MARLEGVKFAYMGDARYNMGNSLMIACSKMGMHFTACAPKKYFPAQELVDECRARGKGRPAATITLTEDVERGHQGCGRDLHRCMGFHGRAG